MFLNEISISDGRLGKRLASPKQLGITQTLKVPNRLKEGVIIFPSSALLSELGHTHLLVFFGPQTGICTPSYTASQAIESLAFLGLQLADDTAWEFSAFLIM